MDIKTILFSQVEHYFSSSGCQTLVKKSFFEVIKKPTAVAAEQTQISRPTYCPTFNVFASFISIVKNDIAVFGILINFKFNDCCYGTL